MTLLALPWPVVLACYFDRIELIFRLKMWNIRCPKIKQFGQRRLKQDTRMKREGCEYL